jgi:alkylhydroperoxidase family enzyme
VDAHRTFLQAAGVGAGVARALESRPLTAALDEDLRALVRLAVRVTTGPAGLAPGEVAEAFRAARSEAEYLDAVGVMVAFNFVNRVANALGVETEIAPRLRGFGPLRSLALRLGALALRTLVDLRPRRLPTRPAAENLRYFDTLFHQAGLGPLPAFFARLGAAPHLLEVQRALLDENLKSFPPDAPDFLHVALVVLDEVAAPVLRARVADRLQALGAPALAEILEAARGGAAGGLSGRERVVLRFARDVTCCSDRIGRERVEELRACGLGDAEVLDLVVLVAHWNAVGRLELLLDNLPSHSAPADGAAAAPVRG